LIINGVRFKKPFAEKIHIQKGEGREKIHIQKGEGREGGELRKP
jgi:hypothetical protein